MLFPLCCPIPDKFSLLDCLSDIDFWLSYFYKNHDNKGMEELFFSRIEDMLKEKKKTQKDMVSYIGISAQSFTNWKSMNSIPSADVAVKIADYLETSVEYLITGKESDEYKNKYDDIKSAMRKVIDEK